MGKNDVEKPAKFVGKDLKEYKRQLRHETGEVSMVDLGKKIQVDELLCTKDKTVSSTRDMSKKAHIFEHNSKPGSHKKDDKGFKIVIESGKVVVTKRGLDPLDIPSTSHTLPLVEDEVEIEPRRSKRARKKTFFASDFVALAETDPHTYREAMTSSEAPWWKESTISEMESIKENDTWELAYLHPGCKAIGCKWVFKRKRKIDGTVEKYKASYGS
ncbi:uncharacterized protein LOC113325137 [Papaver somniferum]|uniref:uncharacterized protein LOC113325137 n=1 Tax=Papaver somniferum TaxID=3469 RepID=UPI000E6FDEF1|nr:uncharacterized protein LOC113325137 [Papaver somniferum]